MPISNDNKKAKAVQTGAFVAWYLASGTGGTGTAVAVAAGLIVTGAMLLFDN